MPNEYYRYSQKIVLKKRALIRAFNNFLAIVKNDFKQGLEDISLRQLWNMTSHELYDVKSGPRIDVKTYTNG